MPHFKDPNTSVVYWFDDADVAAGWPESVAPGLVQISDTEARTLAAQTAVPALPSVVSRRQALLALLAADKLDAVEAHMAEAPRAVRIAWESSATFERDNPLIAALAPQVGLSDVDIDNLFTLAATL